MSVGARACSARALLAVALVLVPSSALSCGGGNSQIAANGAVAEDEWPAPSTAPADAASVKTALACADGANVRVRAYLVAVTTPCAPCSAGENRSATPDPRIGRSPPVRRRDMPGCLPCPKAAATFSDELPTAKAAMGPDHAPLRAVGVAEALQARHVGKSFLLTGTFRTKGESGPELDVTDIRALRD